MKERKSKYKKIEKKIERDKPGCVAKWEWEIENGKEIERHKQ